MRENTNDTLMFYFDNHLISWSRQCGPGLSGLPGWAKSDNFDPYSCVCVWHTRPQIGENGSVLPDYLAKLDKGGPVCLVQPGKTR